MNVYLQIVLGVAIILCYMFLNLVLFHAYRFKRAGTGRWKPMAKTADTAVLFWIPFLILLLVWKAWLVILEGTRTAINTIVDTFNGCAESVARWIMRYENGNSLSDTQ